MTTGRGESPQEVAGQVHGGTRMLVRAEADAGTGPGGAVQDRPGREADTAGTAAAPAPWPGADGTLLAVVPIPGTGISLAIVGYPVPGSVAAAVSTVPPGAVPAGAVPAGALVAGQPDDGRSGLLLDHDQRRVWVDGAEVGLTFQEFELLAFLAGHPATVFSRADLVRQVWQRDFAADSRTVDVHVSRLRHKLGRRYGRCLVTEYRVGYQFRPGG
jgi:Transcriptional regulatory protein, C terminal